MHLEIVVQAHAAAFLGRTAWDLRGDARMMVDAHRTAWGCYRQRALVPGNDALTLELEAWGADVRPTLLGDSWTVSRPLLGSLSEVLDLPEIGREDGVATANVLRAVDDLRATTSGVCGGRSP